MQHWVVVGFQQGVEDERTSVDHGMGLTPARVNPYEEVRVTAVDYEASAGSPFRVDRVLTREVTASVDGGPAQRGALELTPGSDRWGAEITPDSEGRWTYTVEAWSDPLTSWRECARIKIPAGIDTELTFQEGAALHERAAGGVPRGGGRALRRERDGRGGGAGDFHALSSGFRLDRHG